MTPVRVLAVCTGNVCRSPAIERLVTACLAGDGDVPQVTVTSAGTGALIGHAITDKMAVLLCSVGVSTTGFAGSQLQAEDVRDADVVLTATREHRSQTVALLPGAVRRTFTLLELARLGTHMPPGTLTAPTTGERLLELVSLAPSYRARAVAGDDDIPDPWGHSSQTYRQCFDMIFSATLDLANAVVPR